MQTPLHAEIERSVETDYGGLRRVEVIVRVVVCLAALLGGAALLIGLWQPSVERSLHLLLATILLWGAVHLIRSLVGAWGDAMEREQRLRRR